MAITHDEHRARLAATRVVHERSVLRRAFPCALGIVAEAAVGAEMALGTMRCRSVITVSRPGVAL